MLKPTDSTATPPAGLDEKLDRIALELYSLASMLVDEGEPSARLVEIAIETAEVSACQNPIAARKSSRRALCRAAVKELVARDTGSLAAPDASVAVVSCIEEDDLEASGISQPELEAMLAGPDRERMRSWLTQLSTPVRTVFVLRAVAGYCSNDTAALLVEFGGPRAEGWTAKAVSETFRQGLCSLASQLLHANHGKS
jgi:hypothetical protein